MIHIFFAPGMFGSTVEYVLRCYTHEYTPVEANILDDGSMHAYSKEFHLFDTKTISEFVESKSNNYITTVMYPFKEMHLPAILNSLHDDIENTNCVLIHAGSLQDAELNMLFQFYKIANGSYLKQGIDIFCGNNQHNIVSWNTNYKHWSEMQLWELREWISLFYAGWVTEWIDSPTLVNSKWLTLSNSKLLLDPVESWNQIIKFCELTAKPGLDIFANKWLNAQQYIIDEFDTINKIVHNAINKELYHWVTISIVGEAIVQQRLRSLGYEICCDGLNTFPTNSITLSNLLEKQ